MKNLNIYYWIVTGIFAAFMMFSAVPDIILNPEAVAFMTHLGYPNYFTIFIGVAKALGAIAIVVPGFARIKEWAYAGFFFDLSGALYSVVSVEGFDISLSFMILPFGFLFGSYYLWHQKLKAAQN